MSNITLSLGITLLSGMSTTLGFFLIFIKTNDYKKILISSLAFASGVMLTISITDLLPESLILLNNNFNNVISIFICIIFIILGIILSMIIDYYLPDNNYQDKQLYKVGFITMISIILHNIPEGIITFITSTKDITLGINLAIAIALHNIPEGISIAMPIFYSTKSKFKAFIYTFISGMSEVFGGFITLIFLKKYINNTILGILFAIISGIMLNISLCKLLPESLKYNKRKIAFISFGIGILFILIKICK